MRPFQRVVNEHIRFAHESYRAKRLSFAEIMRVYEYFAELNKRLFHHYRREQLPAARTLKGN